ncbi:MAG: hypothetical protein AAGC55_28535 [Myxococcota bacterium]
MARPSHCSPRVGRGPWPGRPATAPIPAEAEAVDAWLSALRASTSGRYLDPGALPAAAAPRARISIVYSDGHGETLVLLSGPGPALWVRRDDEPVVAALDVQPHAGQLLPVAAPRFRRRQLLTLEPYGLRRAEARRGRTTVAHLVRSELLDDWRVLAPGGASVDPSVIAGLRELARLRVQSFALGGRPGEYGLSTPARRIELDYDPGPLDDQGARVVLLIGRQITDGCYGLLAEDPSVFILDRDTCALLLGPWTR